MYIIIDNSNGKMCCEWSYLTNDRQKYLCWKTPTELRLATTYHDGNTGAKLFTTRKVANKFIRTHFEDEMSFIVMADNLL